MKKTILMIVGLLGFTIILQGQKYITKNAYIQFYSHAPIEDIVADNKQVSEAIDCSTGEIVFKVLMKAFIFKKALMQEHFNENYVESDKYPNATFVGKITDIKNVNFFKNGKYEVNVEGNLTIHGVSRHISQKGILEIKGDKIMTTSTFYVLESDFNISIPSTLINNISKSIEIRITSSLEKF